MFVFEEVLWPKAQSCWTRFNSIHTVCFNACIENTMWYENIIGESAQGWSLFIHACISEWKVLLNQNFPMFLVSSTYPVRQKYDINIFSARSLSEWLRKSRHQLLLCKSYPKNVLDSGGGNLLAWDTELQLTSNIQYSTCHLFCLTYPSLFTHTFVNYLFLISFPISNLIQRQISLWAFQTFHLYFSGLGLISQPINSPVRQLRLKATVWFRWRDVFGAAVKYWTVWSWCHSETGDAS